MALQQAGIEWVNENLNSFIRGVERGNSTMQEIGPSASGSMPGLSILQGAVMGIASAITQHLIGAVGKAGQAFIGLAQDSVQVAADFESMTVGLEIAGSAAANAAGVPLEQLSEIALQVGGDTRLLGVSATGAADAMTGLLKSGLSLTEILGDTNGYMQEGAELGGALRAAIDLAAASELDMVQASDLASIALATFGGELETEEERAQFVNDALDNMVKAADASVAEVSDLSEALKNVGPVAAGFGFTLQDTNNALALLSTRGIRGSEAGTALRSMMTNLMRQTPAVTEALEEQGIALYDNEGQMYELVDIIGQFQVATDGMTEAQRNQFVQTVAGTYGMRSLNTLIDEGVEGWYEMSEATTNATGIQAQAEARAQTFASQMEALEGNIETLKIRIGTALLPTLTNLASWFGDVVLQHGPALVNIFEKIGEAFASVADVFMQFASGTPGDFPWEDILPPGLADIAYEVSAAFENLLSTLRGEMSLGDALGLDEETQTNIQGVVDSVIGYAATLQDWWETNSPAIREAAGNLFDRFQETGADLVNNILPFLQERFDALSAWWDENGDTVSTAAQNLAEAIGFIGERAADAWVFIEPLISALTDMSLAFADLVVSLVAGDFEGAWQSFKDIVGTAVDGIIGTLDGFMSWIAGWIGMSWEGIKATWQYNWNTFKEIVSYAWETMKSIVTSVFSLIGTFIRIKVDEIRTFFVSAWMLISTTVSAIIESIRVFISTTFQQIRDVVLGIGGAIRDGLLSVWTTLRDAALGIWEALKNGVAIIVGNLLAYLTGQTELGNQMLVAIWERFRLAVTTIFTNIWIFLVTIWTTIWQFLSTTVENIRANVEAGFNNLKDGVTTAIESAKNFLITAWETIKTSVITTVTNLKDTAVTTFETLKSEVETKIEALKTALPTIWENIKTTAIEKFEELKTNVGEKIEEAKTLVETTIEDIKLFIQGFSLKGVGRSLIQGFIDGIKEKAQAAIDAVGGVIEDAIGKAENLLGIESPSKVFRGMGRNSAAAYALGSEEEANSILDAWSSVMGSLLSMMQNTMAGPAMLANPSVTNVTNTKNVDVTVNAAYANQQSRASIGYDIQAALAAVSL